MKSDAPSTMVRVLRFAAGVVALATAIASALFAEVYTRSFDLMIALGVLNFVLFLCMLWFFHERYDWYGADLDLIGLSILQLVLIDLIVTNLIDTTMRGPAAPMYWVWMFGYTVLTIDIGIGLLNTFPHALGLLRWYAYMLIASGMGIATMVFLPWAGHLCEIADVIMAVVMFRAAFENGPTVERAEARSLPRPA